ncbi:MAG: hypothetical protein HON83_05610 [Candidatus Marinimicrobia bacterium]|jgi:hypothetical protein|nr:hypothetical protein [Candidatus Neomarinimicrobiota bacterium]MBT3829519.1 hypothetical protein [Candidatus Neomarinimicrobiota bacterium]MBT4795885.1 hypothetical protein [Candidatus Neomarinimicrobiota bacterium]MBT6196557.1 hypothetical protein [Candidatus Neomarinimicrobiota bacterium]MBT6930243.1 hypothetical protein [Candidatus Neomarinimicrobiota bacterium]
MRIWVTAGFLLFFNSCGKTDPTVESNPVTNVTFSYIQSANKLYFSAECASAYSGSSLDSVNVYWFGTDSSTTADTIRLMDNSMSGDIIANDDVYAVKVLNDTTSIKNTISVSDTHSVYFSLVAGYGSNIDLTTFSTSISNSGPSITSVSMPDSLKKLGGDSLAISVMVVSADDPDGYEDVKSCYLMFQKPDGTYSSGSPISLYDDGVSNPTYYLWDETANDGKFSRYITIDSGNASGTYNAYFYVRDYAGIESSAYLKTLVVY